MIIYKTINLITGEWYIGQDSKANPNYLGSGVIIKKAIKKYGKINFRKDILEILPNGSTLKDLNAAEIAWIKKTDAVKDPTSYNLAVGGRNSSGSIETKAKISEKLRGNKNGVGKRPNNTGVLWKGKRGTCHHLSGKISPKKGIKENYYNVVKNAVAHGARPFFMINLYSGIAIEYLIISECARENGLFNSAIGKCLRGFQKEHKGFVFIYVE